MNPFLNIMFAATNAVESVAGADGGTGAWRPTRGFGRGRVRGAATKGRLQPGMLADLALLSQDIFKVARQDLPKTTSVLTIVNGRIVHSRSRVAEGPSRPSAWTRYSMIPFRSRPLPYHPGQRRGDGAVHSLDLARHAERLGYAGSGSPSITTCRASRARRPRSSSGTSRAARRRSASARAASCCRTTRRSWSPSSSARSSRCIPGRIDLGLGRAPGTDPRTARALRRDARQRPDAFPHDVVELMSYFAAGEPGSRCGPCRAGTRRADLHPRLEPLRRAGRGGARPAIRVRVAFRATR